MSSEVMNDINPPNTVFLNFQAFKRKLLSSMYLDVLELKPIIESFPTGIPTLLFPSSPSPLVILSSFRFPNFTTVCSPDL